MRVIAGKAKGTRLQMVPGKHVRPTTDRVKESLFHLVGHFFEGGSVLDLFAGTGALGIEALSRGISQAVFVDHSVQSIQTIRANLAKARMEELARVLRGDARAIMRRLIKQGDRFDLIFLDPPYQQQMLVPVLKQIAEGSLLKKEGIVALETDHECALPIELDTLSLHRQKRYGNTMITLYCSNKDSEEE